MTSNPTPREVFSFTFKWWLLIFITFLLPLDILYRGASLAEAMPRWQVGLSCALLVFFFTMVSLIIAIFSYGLSLLFNLVSARGTALVQTGDALLGFLVLTTIFLDYLGRWFLVIFKLPWTLRTEAPYAVLCSIIGLTIVICYAIYNKAALLTKLKLISSTAFKIISIVVIFSTIVSGVAISYNSMDLFFKNESTSLGTNVSPLPNIILVTFDAFRADHSSVYGYKLDTTPNLRALAKESYVFEKMFAASNFTPPTIMSLLSGKYPVNHGVLNDYSYLVGKVRKENLAFILHLLGYQTLAVCSNEFGVPWNRNIIGFDRVSASFKDTGSKLVPSLCKFFFDAGLGSALWLVPLLRETPLFQLKVHLSLALSRLLKPNQANRAASLGDRAPEVTFSQAVEYINHSKSPFFIWVHLMPPHEPYTPREDFLYTFLKEKIFDGLDNLGFKLAPDNRYPVTEQAKIDKFSLRYDEHLLYADHELGNFLAFLKRKGLFQDSIIMVSADHGESFEKGFLGHCGPYLYQPLVHIPFVLHLPGQTMSQRIGANVSQVDIAPTLLDFVGLKPLPWMEGRSFKNTLDDTHQETGIKFSMNLSLEGDPPNFKTKSLAAIKDSYKLIYYVKFGKFEMYDLKKDPRELHNMVNEVPEVFSSMKAAISRVSPFKVSDTLSQGGLN